MTKDVIDAIRERRSVRRFDSKPIPEATVGRIIECGRLAPSAGNAEPWLFVVVENKQVRQDLGAATHGEGFIAAAPVVIAVCLDLERARSQYGSSGEHSGPDAGLLALQDAGAAIENMLLAATAFGLGSCWVGAFDPARVAQVLGLEPERHRPAALVPLGYALEVPELPPHRAVGELVRIIR